jgi:hypothetical protein
MTARWMTDKVSFQPNCPDAIGVADVLRAAAMFWLGILLTALLQDFATAQTGTVAVQPSRTSAVTLATLQPIRRRSPAPRTLHGSISGSQANQSADHAIARLFDRLSEQSRLGFQLYGYLDQGVTLNPSSPRDRTNGPVLSNYRSNDYQMNGLYLVAERKVDSASHRAQIGGRFDMIYGTDAACDGTICSDSRTSTASDNFESYSLANYLFYTINDRWRAGLRFEWLRDDDGTLAGFNPTQSAASGSYYDLSVGLNWRPREDLRIRPEIRHDWQVRDTKVIPAAFDDGNSTNQ